MTRETNAEIMSDAIFEAIGYISRAESDDLTSTILAALKDNNRLLVEGAKPIEDAKPDTWYVTHRKGEKGFNWCFYRALPGEEWEWIDSAGRTTVTHSTFIPPTHFFDLSPLTQAIEEG